MPLTTTGSGYHYPAGTDPAKDGATAIKNLADDIDRKAGTGWSGKVVCTTVNAQSASKSVTFPSGRFTAAPMCVGCTQNSNYIGNVQSITTTSCVGWVCQYEATATSIDVNLFIVARQG